MMNAVCDSTASVTLDLKDPDEMISLGKRIHHSKQRVRHAPFCTFNLSPSLVLRAAIKNKSCTACSSNYLRRVKSSPFHLIILQTWSDKSHNCFICAYKSPLDLGLISQSSEDDTLTHFGLSRGSILLTKQNRIVQEH